MGTTLTEKHVAEAFKALSRLGFPPPDDLQDTRRDVRGSSPAAEGRRLWHLQLQELTREELMGAVAAWARRDTRGFAVRWPTPGDLLAQAREIRKAQAGTARLNPKAEFKRLLSAAQAARSEAMGPTGEDKTHAQDRAWLRLLSARYGTAPDAEGRPRIQMPPALRSALMEVGGLEGLLAISDDFAEGQVLKRFVEAFDRSAEIMPAPRGLQLQAPKHPRLLIDGQVVDPSEALVPDEHGRPEHREVVERDRELAARGAWRRVIQQVVEDDQRSLRPRSGRRGGPPQRLGEVITLPRGGGR